MVPALSPVRAQTLASSIRRLGYVYIPMGMNAAAWTPPTEGRITELSPSLLALTPVLDHITVVSNLELRNAYTTGNHASSNCAFLSCSHAKRTEGSDYELGITVDQIAARALGSETQIPSLEIGTDLIAQVGNCDNGYACAYQNNLSWSSPTTPLPTEADPRVVFERLFGDGGSPERRRAELKKSGSILDWMTSDLARLQTRARRRAIASAWASISIRCARWSAAFSARSRATRAALPDLERPASVPSVWEDHVRLMFDLQVLALQADVTRVVTFQMARETSTRTYPHIGVPEPHHPVSHHTNNPEKLVKLAKINAHHVSLFAYMIEKLQATPDGDGSLLDHTLYLLGSGMGNPDVHDHSNLPIVVAGGRGSQFKGGRHIRFEKPTPLANLHLTLLDKAGVHLDTFVDSTGRISDLEPLTV